MATLHNGWLPALYRASSANGILAKTGLIVICRRRPGASTSVVARIPARDGVEIIWQLHIRAAAFYGRGNWLAMLGVVGIANTVTPTPPDV
jgi:hypothetical protein